MSNDKEYQKGDFRMTTTLTKRKYYTPDGRELLLPCDEYNMNNFLNSGFTLTPPANPVPQVVIASTAQIDNAPVVAVAEKPGESIPADVILCPKCGLKVKGKAGLGIHNRKVHSPKRRYHRHKEVK
jgi:hypothetical protein